MGSAREEVRITYIQIYGNSAEALRLRRISHGSAASLLVTMGIPQPYVLGATWFGADTAGEWSCSLYSLGVL